MQKMHREQQIGRNTERNVDRLKSMLLTLLCAIVILGAGYGVIVESGKKILEKVLRPAHFRIRIPVPFHHN